LATDEVFNKKIEEIAIGLNLKKHTVGEDRVPIYGPGNDR